MRRVFCLTAALAILGFGSIAQTSLAQDSRAQKVLAEKNRPALWYVGISLYDEAWSENDVTEFANQLIAGATNFRTSPIIFSNLAGSSHFQAANEVSIQTAASNIAHLAQPSDVVFIYLSSHGKPSKLALKHDGRQEMVTPDNLRRWLSPIESLKTIVMISSCFSGSFIPMLQSDDRIIITAARADRASFGCRTGALHTFFGKALLDAFGESNVSLHAAFDHARESVATMEQNQNVPRASDPQISVGDRMYQIFDAPVF